MRGEGITLTPSAPMTKSPWREVPSSNVSVPVSGSTDTARWPRWITTGVPGPSGEVATFLRALWRSTRWIYCHGCLTQPVSSHTLHGADIRGIHIYTARPSPRYQRHEPARHLLNIPRTTSHQYTHRRLKRATNMLSIHTTEVFEL